MSELDISRAREQLGISLASWVSSPNMSHGLLPSSWYFLSGIASPAVNMALVQSGDVEELKHLLQIIGQKAVPAVLFFTGQAKELEGQLPSDWNKLGIFTFMRKEILATENSADARVSLATAADVEPLVAMLAESFTVSQDTFRFLVESVNNVDALTQIWVLKVGAEIVSTVTSVRVDDVLAIWCMATPPQHRRAGYASALLDEVLSRSAKNGAKMGLLSASSDGKSLYDIKNWITIEDWDVYFTRATPAAPIQP